jgi:hypothetical protein
VFWQRSAVKLLLCSSNVAVCVHLNCGSVLLGSVVNVSVKGVRQLLFVIRLHQV